MRGDQSCAGAIPVQPDRRARWSRGRGSRWDALTSSRSRATCCVTIRSATRTSARSGSTCPPLRRRARPPLPVDLPDPGDDRAARHVAQPLGVPPEHAGAHRPAVRRGGLPAGVVVFVDSWTSYGGSQFVDSPGTGRYREYLCDEVVPFVDARYRTLAEAAHRGLTGKSSGGYGAMVMPMLRPDLFGGLATHAGDALFEVCYLPEFPDAVRALRTSTTVRSTLLGGLPLAPGVHEAVRLSLVNTWAMAACYSANEDGTIHLPFDPTTGLLRDDVWQRWLAWDPVRMARRHAELSGPARDLHRRRQARRVLPRPRRRGFRRDSRSSDHRRLLRAVRRRPWRIEYRYPVAIRYLAERLQ